jgi:AraC family transcriptional regulator
MAQQLRTGQFYGAVSGSVKESDIVLTEILHCGARRLPAHTHTAAFFCLLLEGSYREQFGSHKIEQRPWTIAFHPPAFTHLDEVGPRGGRMFSIEIAEPWFERLEHGSRGLEPVAEMNGGEMTWLAGRLYRAYKGGDLSPLMAQGITLELLADVIRAPLSRENKKAPWLAKVMEILESEFHEALTVNRIAAEVGIHPVHLARIFRRTYRMTLGEYLNRVRVRFVSEQLARPTPNLAGLALAAGFCDQSHLTRVFKTITGVTPAKFRNIQQFR